jgi:hypothetical protein
VLFQTLLDAGLVDTVEVAVMPVLIGAGIPLLPAGSETTLVLADQITLPSGIVALANCVPGGVGPPPRIGYVTSGGKRAKAGNARKSTASRRAGRAS